MKTKIKGSVVCAAVIIALLAFGCEKKSEEEKLVSDVIKESKEKTKETSKVVQEAQKEVTEKLAEVKPQDMEVGQLRSEAMKLQEQIMSKRTDIDELTEQLKKIPVTEMLGEKAKTLKADIDKLNKIIKELTDQYNLFYNALKAKNGDLSGLKL